MESSTSVGTLASPDAALALAANEVGSDSDGNDDPVESVFFPIEEPAPVFSRAQRAGVLAHLRSMYQFESDPAFKMGLLKTIQQAIQEYASLRSGS